MDEIDNAIIEWLLEPEQPAVRHATLTTLMHRSADDAEVPEARAAMMQSHPIGAILARQEKAGYWDRPDGFYNRKHRGTVWQVIFLFQLTRTGGTSEFATHASSSFAGRRTPTKTPAWSEKASLLWKPRPHRRGCTHRSHGTQM